MQGRRPLRRVTDLLMQSARCLARASRSSRVVCREPASDREGETFCEFKQTDASNRSSWTAGTVCVSVCVCMCVSVGGEGFPPGWRLWRGCCRWVCRAARSIPYSPSSAAAPPRSPPPATIHTHTISQGAWQHIAPPRGGNTGFFTQEHGKESFSMESNIPQNGQDERRSCWGVQFPKAPHLSIINQVHCVVQWVCECVCPSASDTDPTRGKKSPGNELVSL